MTFGPWAVGDTFPNVGSHPTATAALNADIRILTAANDTLEIIPVKVLFESPIVVSGLIRVRVSRSATVLLLISRRYSQDGDGGRRRVCGTGKVLRPGVPRVEDCDRRVGHG